MYTQELLSHASQVREQTTELDFMADAERIVLRFGEWSNPGPSTGGRAIWDNAVFESSVLAESSYFLALHGFYEQAFVMLRSLLDFFVDSTYWDLQMKRLQKEQGSNHVANVTNENGIDYAEWITGHTNKYPRRVEIWKSLKTETNIKMYDTDYKLETNFTKTLADLDKFAHWRPPMRFPREGGGRSSHINVSFNRTNLKKWYHYLRKAFRLVSVLSILQYPDLLNNKVGNEFQILEPETVDHLRETIAATTH